MGTVGSEVSFCLAKKGQKEEQQAELEPWHARRTSLLANLHHRTVPDAGHLRGTQAKRLSPFAVQGLTPLLLSEPRASLCNLSCRTCMPSRVLC